MSMLHVFVTMHGYISAPSVCFDRDVFFACKVHTRPPELAYTQARKRVSVSKGWLKTSSTRHVSYAQHWHVSLLMLTINIYNCNLQLSLEIQSRNGNSITCRFIEADYANQSAPKIVMVFWKRFCPKTTREAQQLHEKHNNCSESDLPPRKIVFRRNPNLHYRTNYFLDSGCTADVANVHYFLNGHNKCHEM